MNRAKLEKYVVELCRYGERYIHDVFDFYLDKNTMIQARFDDAYDSDNCLDEEDENYDEFLELLFVPINTATNGFLIVNYHTLPYKVVHNGEVVYELNDEDMDFIY